MMNQTIFRISGNDKLSFLQGQLTNDVNLLNSSRAVFAGYCDPKGRLLSTLLLAVHGDDWLLLLPADNADAITRRLQMFVMRADVQFTAADDLHCAVQPAQGVSAEAWSCAQNDETTTVTLPGQLVMVIQPTAADSDITEAQLIAAGLPEVAASISGELLPQSINLDLIGGVSFNKGCYTGQEIIARLHFRGTPARRLYQLRKDSEEQANPGEKISDENGTAIGMVVRDASGSDTLLASIKTSSAESSLSTAGGIGLSQALALAELS